MADILDRLRNPPFGTETSERHLMTDAAKEIELLRIAVVKYGDRSRMATVEPMSVQQAIDRAFEFTPTK